LGDCNLGIYIVAPTERGER